MQHNTYIIVLYQEHELHKYVTKQTIFMSTSKIKDYSTEN